MPSTTVSIMLNVLLRVSKPGAQSYSDVSFRIHYLMLECNISSVVMSNIMVKIYIVNRIVISIK